MAGWACAGYSQRIELKISGECSLRMRFLDPSQFLGERLRKFTARLEILPKELVRLKPVLNQL